jgi:hypothetical protein
MANEFKIKNGAIIDGQTSMGTATIEGPTSIGTPSPDPSALLDLTSTTQGFLPPRMDNGDINAIATPALGLMVFDLSSDEVNVYTSSGWRRIQYV